MKKNVFYTAIVLLTGSMIAACSGSDDILSNPSPEPQTPTKGNIVVLSGTLGSKGDQTRTIATDGKGSWTVGDKFAIYYVTENDGHATATATVNSINDNGSANFTASLESPKTGDNDITLVYPDSVHDGNGGFKTDALMEQEGTLDYINEHGLDIETATTTMNVEETKATLNSNVKMQPQVCLYKFDLRNQYYENLSITKLEMSDGTHNYTITPAIPTNIFTVTLVPFSNATFKFTATTTEDTKLFTKRNGVTLANCTLANIGDVFDKDGNVYEASTGPGAIYSREYTNRWISAGRFYSSTLSLYKAYNSPGVAVIAYVGEHGTVDDSSKDAQTGFRGLAVSMNYISSAEGFDWCSQASDYCNDQYNNDVSVAREWRNGIDRTTYLIGHEGHSHPAAAAARNYGVSHPTGTSDWFLPSLGQWQLIFQGLATKAGNMTELCTMPMLIFPYPDSYLLSNDNVGPVLAAADADGFHNCMWSSSECSKSEAWALAFDLSATILSKKGSFKHNVRPVLAF